MKKRKNKDPYEVLGVNKKASNKDIKKAYHKESKKHHPDKGGSQEKQQEINEAYLILINPFKRKQYDTTGNVEDYEQKGLNIAMKIMQEAVKANPNNVKDFFINEINKGIASVKNEQKKAKDEMTKLRIFLNRLEKAPENDILTPMINQEIYHLEVRIEEGDLLLKSIKRAKAILDEYIFSKLGEEMEVYGFGNIFVQTIQTPWEQHCDGT